MSRIKHTNMFIHLLLVFIVSANCGKTVSSKTSTNSYAQYANAPEKLYMKESFNIDMCKKFVSRKQFVSLLLKKNINCRGWCFQNSYVYQGLQSYQAEHIIDLKNSILPNCNKNIYGNLIMSYGKWNNEVGQLTWENIQKEKTAVYKGIFNQAIENIKKCDPGCDTSTVIDIDVQKMTDIIINKLMTNTDYTYQIGHNSNRFNSEGLTYTTKMALFKRSGIAYTTIYSYTFQFSYPQIPQQHVFLQNFITNENKKMRCVDFLAEFDSLIQKSKTLPVPVESNTTIPNIYVFTPYEFCMLLASLITAFAFIVVLVCCRYHKH